MIDIIKVETDVSVDNEEDVIGMESEEVCVPQECEPKVSHILGRFLLMHIFVCGFAHMELLRSVDLHPVFLSGALCLLQCSELTHCLSVILFVHPHSPKLRAECWLSIL